MKTKWYLWAVNDDPMTNQYLVQVIGEQYPDELYRDKLCADGERRNLFGVSEWGNADVRRAVAAVHEFNLKLGVFRESEGAAIVRYELWRQPVRKAARQQSYMCARFIAHRSGSITYQNASSRGYREGFSICSAGWKMCAPPVIAYLDTSELIQSYVDYLNDKEHYIRRYPIFLELAGKEFPEGDSTERDDFVKRRLTELGITHFR
jgi:hypothetical protein